MSTRGDLLLPEGWKPARNGRVIVLRHRDEPAPPAGVWRIVDRSAGEPGPHWWLMPHDDDARRWAEQHPTRIVQRCLEVKGLRLAPPGTRQPDLGATTGPRGRR